MLNLQRSFGQLEPLVRQHIYSFIKIIMHIFVNLHIIVLLCRPLFWSNILMNREYDLEWVLAMR